MLKNLRSKPYKAAWRPTLDEVLNNTTPPPYTLSAFMKYLSQNHCLETLDFILEAKRYRESYKSLVESAREPTVTTNCSASINLSQLYQLLLKTYVLPGAPREVNLPVNVRDDLLQHKITSTPPSPETLDPAVRSIHDLMEGSIFFSFLNRPSIFFHRDATLRASDQNDSRPCLSRMNSDSQPTEPVQNKRSFLNPLGRTWLWLPWNR
ncbi:hypothetical protein N7522_011889 [Penicillium canescens]|nr:hypothetical protein N7522_011889 [Penicillium canescens]